MMAWSRMEDGDRRVTKERNMSTSLDRAERRRRRRQTVTSLSGGG